MTAPTISFRDIELIAARNSGNDPFHIALDIIAGWHGR
jgi:hypothetical protein